MSPLTLMAIFFFGELNIINGEETNSCHRCEKDVDNISKWSKFVLKSQDDERISDILDKSGLDEKSKLEVIDKYYEIAAKPIQGSCNVLKRIAGIGWKGSVKGFTNKANSCGFQDGEHLICMDLLYKAVLNQTCLVYSFGLAADWGFEVFMAEIG